MRHAVAAFAAVFLIATPPATAQTGEFEGEGEIDEGMSRLSDGAGALLRGLLGEVEPQMQDMLEALRQWDLEGFEMGDLQQYHSPERLPNGDIIIRRKPSADEAAPMDDEIDI